MSIRDEFEKWLRARPEVLNVGYNAETDRYLLREDQERYEAWKASRAAIVIELPAQEKFTNWARYSEWRLQRITELEALGLTVTP